MRDVRYRPRWLGRRGSLGWSSFVILNLLTAVYRVLAVSGGDLSSWVVGNVKYTDLRCPRCSRGFAQTRWNPDYKSRDRVVVEAGPFIIRRDLIRFIIIVHPRPSFISPTFSLASYQCHGSNPHRRREDPARLPSSPKARSSQGRRGGNDHAERFDGDLGDGRFRQVVRALTR